MTSYYEEPKEEPNLIQAQDPSTGKEILNFLATGTVHVQYMYISREV